MVTGSVCREIQHHVANERSTALERHRANRIVAAWEESVRSRQRSRSGDRAGDRRACDSLRCAAERKRRSRRNGKLRARRQRRHASARSQDWQRGLACSDASHNLVVRQRAVPDSHLVERAGGVIGIVPRPAEPQDHRRERRRRPGDGLRIGDNHLACRCVAPRHRDVEARGRLREYERDVVLRANSPRVASVGQDGILVFLGPGRAEAIEVAARVHVPAPRGAKAGADIARAEGYKEGIIPLHTLRSDIDYAVYHAATQYGRLGVKVWICRGEIRPELVKKEKGE